MFFQITQTVVRTMCVYLENTVIGCLACNKINDHTGSDDFEIRCQRNCKQETTISKLATRYKNHKKILSNYTLLADKVVPI